MKVKKKAEADPDAGPGLRAVQSEVQLLASGLKERGKLC